MIKTRVFTPVFRVSFPNVSKPRAAMKGSADQTPKYSVCAMFEPATFTAEDKARWAELLKLVNETSVEAFKKPLKDLPANFKKPFHDGNEKDLEGFGPGKIFVNLSSKNKPGLVTVTAAGVSDILDETEFYAGCYARASVVCYSYDNAAKGISLGLQNLMKVADGERIDGRVSASKEFADFGAENLAAVGVDDFGI